MKFSLQHKIFTTGILTMLALSVSAQEKTLSFPGAEGFGRYTTGGRGGKVLFVTKLTDDGSEGTLRYALEQKGPRYIVFKTAGTIYLESPLKIKEGNVTIAGQTAPGDGITIANYETFVAADNVIIRFLRFRMGDQKKFEGDALGARFIKDLIVDHCSMSWSTDETASIYVNENTTLQWCVIAESLRNSAHQKGAHGYGGIAGGKFASFHHNIYAHHDSRNPRLGEYAGSKFALTDLTDFRNNVIYNWGNNNVYGGEGMNVNIVNNYYKPGPASMNKKRIVAIDKNEKPETEVYNIWGKYYINGNVSEGNPDVTADNWNLGVFNQMKPSYSLTDADKNAIKINKPHDIQNNVKTDSPKDAYDKILKIGGASLVRDAADIRVLKEVKNGTFTYNGSLGSKNGIIDSQNDVGGFPNLNPGKALLDSDSDGMPDEWEIKHKLNPKKNNANGRELDENYDNIEVYMNDLVKKITDKQ
ncbi:pectate lyase [Chryseobacterium sp. Ch-15]|uniref:Pectate lyase n=1 Tax=Chryseobacterium muglaense TaxID=2893752 RepID=A0A9Q3UT04_9FLAO|nr:pectate lyase [Chryseobacterium muglaense]MBD3903492.1 pectate lyase [Chryseobacterium muglaense]MCC9034564.1 pectate lyase [Chryseobacterium muglaense]MCM2552827.1 pectate lyase [Chryseobacterium muglaense]